ncbi:MAG: protease modulator HflC [Lentisphaeria bacterium]|nr:protease modulator HflC [Lentisphaeria bacterium]
MKNKSDKLLAIGILIVGILAFAIFPLCSYQVRYTEVAVISSFGKNIKVVDKPGLYFKAPFHSVQKMDKSIQVFTVSFDENYTKNSINLSVKFFTMWRIDEPEKFLNTIGSKDRAQQVLEDLIRTEKRFVFSAHPSSDLISANLNEKGSFEKIEAEILARVKTEAHSKYGITVERVGIESINLPANVTADVFNRMVTERNNKANKIRQEGELKASKILDEARVESSKLVADAKKQATEIRSSGDLEAVKFYQSFESNQDKEFAMFLRRLEALEKVLSEKTYMVIDRDLPPFDLLKIQPAID